MVQFHVLILSTDPDRLAQFKKVRSTNICKFQNLKAKLNFFVASLKLATLSSSSPEKALMKTLQLVR